MEIGFALSPLLAEEGVRWWFYPQKKINIARWFLSMAGLSGQILVAIFSINLDLQDGRHELFFQICGAVPDHVSTSRVF